MTWRREQRSDPITCVHGLHRLGDKLGLVARAASWLAAGLLAARLDLAHLKLTDLPERVADGAAMARHVGAWKAQEEQTGVKADWQFTTADARTKLRKLYPTIDA